YMLKLKITIAETREGFSEYNIIQPISTIIRNVEKNINPSISNRIGNEPSPESKEKKSLISKFHDIVSQGPLYICTCCDQLWYKHSVIPAASLKESNPDAQKRLLNRKSLNNVEWLCRTCNKHLKNNKVPPCAAINGMQFPEKPSFFDLNELECRLLAPRLAFQKLMQAPRGRQLKINGNIVNVPAVVANTVNIPNKVAEAGRWLVNNGNLYKDEGITFNDTWLEDNSNKLVFDDNCDDQISEGSETVDCNADKTQQILTCDDDNNWSEDEAEMPAGITDTMLTSPDFLTDNERQHILNLAPELNTMGSFTENTWHFDYQLCDSMSHNCHQ
ncbi:Hypothetical predicted protein, partial [Paramuricea clavata]